jgi:hypothetical protein
MTGPQRAQDSPDACSICGRFDLRKLLETVENPVEKLVENLELGQFPATIPG